MNELARKAKQGDAKAAEEMLHRLRPLVLSSMRRYFYRREWFEDLVQEGMLEVLEALADFDEERQVPFIAYAQLRLRYFYLNKREVSTSSLDEEVVEGISRGELVADTADVARELEERERTKALERALGTLTVRQRRAVVDFYLKRRSLSQVAEGLGVSYRTAVNTKTRALEKLRKEMKEW